jgi:hypothetical protein
MAAAINEFNRQVKTLITDSLKLHIRVEVGSWASQPLRRFRMMCFVKRALPFALTLTIGIAAASLFYGTISNKGELNGPEARQYISHSKTWLRIHSQPTPVFPKEVDEIEGHFLLRLYVRLDASGTVTEAMPTLTTLPSNCVDAVVSAAKRIEFTPATEDGKPISVIGLIEYDFYLREALGKIYGKAGRLDGGDRRFPWSSRLKIISVEGAREPEGWQIVYE